MRAGVFASVSPLRLLSCFLAHLQSCTGITESDQQVECLFLTSHKAIYWYNVIFLIFFYPSLVPIIHNIHTSYLLSDPDLYQASEGSSLQLLKFLMLSSNLCSQSKKLGCKILCF